jgi:hypothetical protein
MRNITDDEEMDEQNEIVRNNNPSTNTKLPQISPRPTTAPDEPAVDTVPVHRSKRNKEENNEEGRHRSRHHRSRHHRRDESGNHERREHRKHQQEQENTNDVYENDDRGRPRRYHRHHSSRHHHRRRHNDDSQERIPNSDIETDDNQRTQATLSKTAPSALQTDEAFNERMKRLEAMELNLAKKEAEAVEAARAAENMARAASQALQRIETELKAQKSGSPIGSPMKNETDAESYLYEIQQSLSQSKSTDEQNQDLTTSGSHKFPPFAIRSTPLDTVKTHV